MITGQIVEQLERGVVPWARPWKVDGLAPSNLVSRRPYRGINVFLLAFRAASTSWWLTFRQARRWVGRYAPVSGRLRSSSGAGSIDAGARSRETWPAASRAGVVATGFPSCATRSQP